MNKQQHAIFSAPLRAGSKLTGKSTGKSTKSMKGLTDIGGSAVRGDSSLHNAMGIGSSQVGSTRTKIRSAAENGAKVFHFHILGVPYKLKTSHDDETVAHLVEHVNQSMNQAVSVTKNGSFQNAAVLTALNLAEELTLMKRQMAQELQKLESKALEIAQELESQRATKANLD